VKTISRYYGKIKMNRMRNLKNLNSGKKKMKTIDRFSDPKYNRSSEERGVARCLQAYLILIFKAMDRKTIRCGEFAKMLGYECWTPSIGKVILGRLDNWCDENHLPLLSVLVVEGKFGRSHNADQISGYLAQRELVYDEAWLDIIPPSFLVLWMRPLLEDESI
jgi:hypothetical protein